MTTPTIAAKQCLSCHTPFELTRPNKIYCSEKCSAKAKRTRRNQNPQWVELQRKRHREARLRKHQPVITQLPTKQCESCQTPFELRQPNKRYCSERCRRKAKRERTEHPSRSTLRTKTCTECKQTFTQTGSGGTNAKLCKYCKPRSPHYKHRARIQLQKLISASHKRQRKQTAQMHLDAQCVICNEWYKLRTVGVVGGQRTCSTACGNKQEHRRPARIKAARARHQRLKQDPDWVERERERQRKYSKQRKNNPQRQRYLRERYMTGRSTPLKRNHPVRQLDQAITNERTGYIYVLHPQTTNTIKIGYTKHHPTHRAKQAQTYSPHKIGVMTSFKGSRATERYIHKQLDAHRMEGEWFQLNTETQKTIKKWHAIMSTT